MDLKRFWVYAKPVFDALNANDFDKAIDVLDNMATQEGACDRWKQLVLRFVSAGGLLPDHLDAMMMLGETDEWLKEYVARKSSLITKLKQDDEYESWKSEQEKY